MAAPDLERVEIASAESLREWLEAHHARDDSVLLVTWRKPSPRHVSNGAVLDELVAHGWIDGRRYVLDDARTMQLIAPRKVKHWSASYKDRAERLTAEGRMHAAGLRSVAEGRENGLWTFMDDVDALIAPPDLAEALAGAKATAAWDESAPSYRRNVLRWIKLARTDATRGKRVTRAAEHAARGERIAQM